MYSGIQVVAEYEACGLDEVAQPPAQEPGWMLGRVALIERNRAVCHCS